MFSSAAAGPQATCLQIIFFLLWSGRCSSSGPCEANLRWREGQTSTVDPQVTCALKNAQNQSHARYWNCYLFWIHGFTRDYNKLWEAICRQVQVDSRWRSGSSPFNLWLERCPFCGLTTQQRFHYQKYQTYAKMFGFGRVMNLLKINYNFNSIFTNFCKIQIF